MSIKKHGKMPKESLLRNTIAVPAFLLGAMICSVLFLYAGGSGADVASVFMLAVVLTARYTDGYIPGIIASVIGFSCVNCVFTHPGMKPAFTSAAFPVTFIAMLLVSVITTAAAVRLKEQNHILSETGKETMRANLLRAAAHDLRTPLTGIIGASSVYLENESHMTGEEKTAMVSNIREDADWLLNMVENLLTVTRIQNTGAPVVKTVEPLEEVAAEAVQRLRKRLPDAVVHVTAPDDFIMIPMDATLIEQVIINLLENAVYHSHSEAPIDFNIAVHDGFAWFDVTDHGCGISSKRLDTLFSGYSPALNTCGDSYKGMGIGLSICKTIVTAHGGSISASNEKQGARFTFTLPLGEDTHE